MTKKRTFLGMCGWLFSALLLYQRDLFHLRKPSIEFGWMDQAWVTAGLSAAITVANLVLVVFGFGLGLRGQPFGLVLMVIALGVHMCVGAFVVMRTFAYLGAEASHAATA